MALANNTLAILNAIRASASAEYQARVPEATRTNITAVGNAITTYAPAYTEFVDALLVKIGLSLISSKLAKNKLDIFKKGMIDGQDVEEIFLNMASAEHYDPEGEDLLTRKKPDINVIYHRQNREDKYKVSISEQQLKRAFTSPERLGTFIEAQLNTMYSGANYDEYVLMKQLLASYETNYATYTVPIINSASNIKAFVKTLRKASMDISFPSTKYNAEGVITFTDPEEQILLINKDVVSEVDVDLLSQAFNRSDTDVPVTAIYVDDFGTMTNTYALLIDKDFFMVYDTLREMRDFNNGSGLFINYWLHIWQILSLSRFKNAVRFVISKLQAPVGITYNSETGLIGVDATMEYADSEDLIYTPCTASPMEVDVVVGQTLLIRYKETSTSLASLPFSLEITA